MLALLVVVLACGEGRAEAGESQEARCVVGAELDGVVSGAMADYLADAVSRAEVEGCALLVRVDTPGGQLVATRRITGSFLEAAVPVIVYVAPRGARAGSAGMFVTIAGHVAAMAPGTNIGAAHPVVGLGGDPDEAMGEKIRSDTAALARAIAEIRGRNAEWAERAVLESVSATAREALELDVIDEVAPSERELLRAIDGAQVEVDDEATVLRVADAQIEPFEMTLRQRLLSALGNPELAYLLLMLGIIGLLVELSNPGILVPGIAGGLALFFAALGLELLPVSVGGLALVALGLALMIAELYVTSYGLLALGGVVSLVLGSVLLIDRDAADYFADQELVVSWGVIIPLAAVMVGVVLALAWKLGRSQRIASPTGTGGLIGATGVALEELGPDGGSVRVGSERWFARADAAIGARDRVEVVGIEGLELRVRRVGNAPRQRSPERAGARGAKASGRAAAQGRGRKT